MDYLELMKQNKPYASCDLDMPNEYQITSKKLCFEYNHTAPDETEKRREILSELFGTSNDNAIIEPSFRCDYGFNIHLHGFALINYNCVFLDTSPIHIGKNVFIAPGVCLACAGHAILPKQRAEAIGTSAPIIIEDDVCSLGFCFRTLYGEISICSISIACIRFAQIIFYGSYKRCAT